MASSRFAAALFDSVRVYEKYSWVHTRERKTHARATGSRDPYRSVCICICHLSQKGVATNSTTRNTGHVQRGIYQRCSFSKVLRVGVKITTSLICR